MEEVARELMFSENHRKPSSRGYAVGCLGDRRLRRLGPHPSHTAFPVTGTAVPQTQGHTDPGDGRSTERTGQPSSEKQLGAVGVAPASETGAESWGPAQPAALSAVSCYTSSLFSLPQASNPVKNPACEWQTFIRNGSPDKPST